MRRRIMTILIALFAITGAVLGFVLGGFTLNDTQKHTLLILGIICGASMLYCFVVGEITRNNSQMDKLWSILPIAYTWVVAVMSGFNFRSLIIAILVTLWGVRLTWNFARKGAYQLKFWAGEEDYRWQVLRQNKYLSNKFAWAMFDLFFISIYQNALVLAICLPSVAVMSSDAAIGVWDFVATGLATAFLLLETVSDEQQMDFQTKKYELLNEGMKLEELPEPYNKGFNTVGLWARSAHPNYFSEQMFWFVIYFFVLGAGVASYGFFHWTLVGSMVLFLLFLGSSNFGESVSSSKYPEYKFYLDHISRYAPLWKYKEDKYQNE